MSDATLRELERRVLAGDREALEPLKREWARVEGSTRKCWVCYASVPLIAYEDHVKACRDEGGPLERWAAEALKRGQVARKVPLYDEPPEQVPSLTPAPGPAPAPPIRAPRVVPIPSSGVIASREPLWFRGRLRPGEFSFSFVRGCGGNAMLTNLSGGGPSLPVGSHFFWYGLSLVPDAGNDPSETLEVWNEGELAFRKYMHTDIFSLPCRLVMTRPECLPSSGELVGLESADCRFSTVLRGRPLELLALEAFDLELRAPSQMRSRPFDCMLVLFGIRLRQVTS